MSVLGKLPVGTPLPQRPHAVSVSLPTWASVVGYEEGDEAVLGAMQCGYPRFFIDLSVAELCKAIADEANGLPYALVSPSIEAAGACRDYVRQWSDAPVEVFHSKRYDCIAVLTTADGALYARSFWQHTGEIISSRLATRLLKKNADRRKSHPAVYERLREQLGALYGRGPESVWLFPTGMSAIWHVHKALQGRAPGGRSGQIGFSYVDTLKVLQLFGEGLAFHDEDLPATFENDSLSGVFLEAPSNPLLKTPDVLTIASKLRKRSVPLVIDDTLGVGTNLELIEHADVVVASLTKLFVGTGDAMGGCVILPEESVLQSEISASLASIYSNNLWWEDAEALLNGARDIVARSRRANATADEVARYLKAHDEVEQVFYPDKEDLLYSKLLKEGGGCGLLLSFLLRDAERTSPKVYDALDLAKGPGFGTNFSMVCPYTMLAHYRELDWARSQGVSPYLLRLSVGQEDPKAIISSLEYALEKGRG